MTKENIRITN